MDIDNLEEETESPLHDVSQEEKPTPMTNKDFQYLVKIRTSTPQVVKKDKQEEYDKKERVSVLEKLAQKYRDRAEERRRGLYDEPTNPDDCEINRFAKPDKLFANFCSEQLKVKYRASKLLGGDLSRTHLVKGLDFILLDKVKAAIQKKAIEDKFLASKKIQEECLTMLHSDKVIFRSDFGRRVYEAVFKSRSSNGIPYFVPGKMVYRVDLVERDLGSDIPATVIRNDTAISNAERRLKTTNAVIDTLKLVLGNHRESVPALTQVKKIHKSLTKTNVVRVNEDIVLSVKGSRKRPYKDTEPISLSKKKPKILCEDKSKTDPGKAALEKTYEKLKKLTSSDTSYVECYPGGLLGGEDSSDDDFEPEPPTKTESNSSKIEYSVIDPVPSTSRKVKNYKCKSKNIGKRIEESVVSRKKALFNNKLLDNEWKEIQKRLTSQPLVPDAVSRRVLPDYKSLRRLI